MTCAIALIGVVTTAIKRALRIEKSSPQSPMRSSTSKDARDGKRWGRSATGFRSSTDKQLDQA